MIVSEFDFCDFPVPILPPFLLYKTVLFIFLSRMFCVVCLHASDDKSMSPAFSLQSLNLQRKEYRFD